jgi:hypothetical protein
VATNDAGGSEQANLEEVTRGLIAVAQVQTLLALDDVWTSYLESRAGGGEPDFEGLINLAARIDTELTRAPQTANFVRISVERHSDELVSRWLARIHETEPQSDGVLDWLLNGVGERSVRQVLISACLYVERHVVEERKNLSGKVQLLRASKLPDPDLSPAFRCAWTVVGVGAITTLAAAGAVPVVGVGAAVGLGALGGVYGLSTVWKKSGCAEVWRTVRALATPA